MSSTTTQLLQHGCVVSIEAVYFIINHHGRLYRKLLAPEPKKFRIPSTRDLSPFVDILLFIEADTVYFEIDLKINNLKKRTTASTASFSASLEEKQTDNNSNSSNNNNDNNNAEINLLFHEEFKERGKTLRFYVENMGKFSVSNSGEYYRYTTTPLQVLNQQVSESLFGRTRYLRLEICDLDRTAWFVGEWKIKFRGLNDSDALKWLEKGTNLFLTSTDINDHKSSHCSNSSSGSRISSDIVEKTTLTANEEDKKLPSMFKSKEDFSIASISSATITSNAKTSSLIPSKVCSDSVSLDGKSSSCNIKHLKNSLQIDRSASSIISRSNSNSPLSSISVSSEELNDDSNSNSFIDSFEDLELDDFELISTIDGSEDHEALPDATKNSNNILHQRLWITEENEFSDAIGYRRTSLIASRSESPLQIRQGYDKEKEEQISGDLNDLSTVDIFHQVGSLFFSSNLGQFVTSSLKSDPSRQNIKTSYSTSSIFLLGIKYQLQGIVSNFLLINNEQEETEIESHDEDATNINVETEIIGRSNQFSNMIKRLKYTNEDKMVLREILTLQRSGPIITNRLKSWFESFGWYLREFSPATLKVQTPQSFEHLFTIEVFVYSLKPTSKSPSNTPELFLTELVLSMNHGSMDLEDQFLFRALAQGNAYFVELTAFLVQLELGESRGRAPEIVSLETLNSHVQPKLEMLTQSRNIPIVKYSVIPDVSVYVSYIYFWSDHLQGWLLQSLQLQGMVLSIHPLIDARMAIQVHLSGSHLSAAQDEAGEIGTFSLITSRGQTYYFRVLQVSDLKEILGRIRYFLLNRNQSQSPGLSTNFAASTSNLIKNNTSSSKGRRNKRQGSTVLQVDKLYKGSDGSLSAISVSDAELERIRTQNLSVMDSFLEDFKTRFWFTYRRGFSRIEPSLFTSDLGWGCMLRTGQCLMAEAFSRFYFGRNWRLWQLEIDNTGNSNSDTNDATNFDKIKLMKRYYDHLIGQFIDSPTGEYSVHRLACEGAKIGTPIGQWFGPSIIGKVLRSITNNQKDSPFWVYLSSNGVFPLSHLLKIVSTRALLLLLPLRLGVEVLNPIYGHFIRGALRSSASVGIVGGLPNKSLYFVGYQDWDLLFLDPHILKSYDPETYSSTIPAEHLHTNTVRSIPIEQVDPSMLFGFVCCTAEEVVRLGDHLIKLNRIVNILSIQ